MSESSDPTYVDEYRAMPGVLGTIEPDENGPGGVRFVEEAEIVEEVTAEATRLLEAVPFGSDPTGNGVWAELLELAYGKQIERAQAEDTALREAHPEWFSVPASAEYEKEVRVVDPDTGGMKGSKLARFDMIPPDVLWELAEHYGKGEAKYPSDPETGLPNWQNGYSWRLSVAALERHLNAWKRGEDIDPETGSSHLIAVIWHAMALRWFQTHNRGKDYRAVANGEAA